MARPALPYRGFLVQMLEAQTEMVRILEQVQWHHALDGSDEAKAYLISVRAGDILYEKLRYYDHIKSKRPAWVQRESGDTTSRVLLDGSDNRSEREFWQRRLGRSVGELGGGREEGRDGDEGDHGPEVHVSGDR